MSGLNLNGVLGTTVIGSWAATALFTLELTWAFQYYHQASKQDGLYFRLLVAATILIDLAGLLGAQAEVYMFCVLHWGDLEYLQQQYWPVPYCFTTGIVTDAIVQGFLVVRYFRLSKNWIVTGVLAILAFVTFGSGLSVVILSQKWSEVEQRLLLQIPLKLWLILDVITNVFILSAFIYKVYGQRDGSKATKRIVRQFIILSLESAILPSLCAISALVAYLASPDTNISAIFLWLLPRAYVLTMLYTLNIRQIIREDTCVEEPGSGDATLRGTRALRSGQTLTATLQVAASSRAKQNEYSMATINTSNK